MQRRRFLVIIEQDEDGKYIASVPSLPGCHTQADSLTDLVERIQEAIKLYFDDEVVSSFSVNGIIILEFDDNITAE